MLFHYTPTQMAYAALMTMALLAARELIGRLYLRADPDRDPTLSAHGHKLARLEALKDVKPKVLAVHKDTGHNFSKPTVDSITLVQGMGVEGDSHAGKTVQHLYRLQYDPGAPNLRQVHFMHSELFKELAVLGFEVRPGDLGENITTQNVNILALPKGTKLALGDGGAMVEVTGLRNPCPQIEKFQKGLLAKVLKDSDGRFARRSGIMSVVLEGGVVRPGDDIEIVLPDVPHEKLEVV